MLEQFHIIAFTHRSFEVSEVGKLHIQEDKQAEKLHALKEQLQLSEIMFLSTCNRVEFLFCTDHPFNDSFIHQFFAVLYQH